MASTLSNMWRELQFGRLEKNVKNHLTKVYTTMGLALVACAVGSWIHMAHIFSAGLLTGIGTIVAVIALLAMQPVPENSAKRFSLLMGIALMCGITQGPLLQVVASIDPSIIMTAFLATALVFICFSISALLSNDRKWLAFGGILSSGLSWLLLFGFLNIFIKSQLIFELKLYAGLAIFCGFVLYDTQLIVEKCRCGDDDYIGHSLTLFLDLLNIFRHILILLTDKEVKRDRRNKRE
jgi:FtsH-binding integral membrane protein